jgi:hypothetical protein
VQNDATQNSSESPAYLAAEHQSRYDPSKVHTRQPKKYCLDFKDEVCGLYRIIALRDFGVVKKGDKGGWVSSESNLSQGGNCWIFHEASATGNSHVSHEAILCGSARISDTSAVFEEGCVGGCAVISGDACVYGKALVDGTVHVSEKASVSGDSWLRGRISIFGKVSVNNVSLCATLAESKQIATQLGLNNYADEQREVTKKKIYEERLKAESEKKNNDLKLHQEGVLECAQQSAQQSAQQLAQQLAQQSAQQLAQQLAANTKDMSLSSGVSFTTFHRGDVICFPTYVPLVSRSFTVIKSFNLGEKVFLRRNKCNHLPDYQIDTSGVERSEKWRAQQMALYLIDVGYIL